MLFGSQAVYFVKNKAEAVKKDTFKTLVGFGDVSHIPLDQLNSMVESVSHDKHTHMTQHNTHTHSQLVFPIMANQGNRGRWPEVVSRDVIKNIGGLSGDVYMFSGQVKGQTLLPLPPETESVVRAAEREARCTHTHTHTHLRVCMKIA